MIDALSAATPALTAQHTNAGAVADNLAHASTSSHALSQGALSPSDPAATLGPDIASETSAERADKLLKQIVAKATHPQSNEGAIDIPSIAISALTAQKIDAGEIADTGANAIPPSHTFNQVTLLPIGPGVAVGPVIASVETNVNHGNDLLKLMAAQNAYAAAARVARASDELAYKLLAAL